MPCSCPLCYTLCYTPALSTFNNFVDVLLAKVYTEEFDRKVKRSRNEKERNKVSN